MGTILFYIFESTLCLTILYLLFRLFFRKDTLFRTNRYLLLMGTVACTLLPLLQIDVPQYTTLQLPITIIRKSKFPQNPKRSVRFSGKRTKRSVQKRKARNTQKAETKVL